jgi:outer membrane protein assembly factor BamB
MDCLGAGRKNTFIAFDPRSGHIFWDSSYKGLIIFWNIYSPVVLPYDFDNDGVNEIVISAGGNPSIPSHIHERDPGIIFTVSGKTGEFIGKYLTIPERKETYMSPVLHVQADDSAYLLIGSGGETVPGNLYMISLPDFYDFVMRNSEFEKPSFKGNFNTDIENTFVEDRSITKLYILYGAEAKGVMVPPVLVDINKDGNKDILVSSFDGKLALYNGWTFELMWERNFDCFETYTTAAPGYFNEDETLDVMLIQNLGTFDRYANSSVLVLDGKDGSTLWQMDARRYFNYFEVKLNINLFFL